MTAETTITKAEQKRLLASLAELHRVADSNDVTRTAADIGRSVGAVQRYLRGDIRDWDTAKSIVDRLRELTTERAKATLEAVAKL